MMKLKKEESQVISLDQYICLRCNHSWYPRKDVKPKICPRCISAYWDIPRKK